ncbi:hypothetical protein ECOH1_00011 [Escherichia phage ECOH1]|uniref:Uncharacterized protein n=1 Tax=Escherichia phage ECOH1 TaxID=2944654 RepID=A0A9E7LJI9_9CAUD|nr:hypothetical protein ECOH1_00011 [Escherichia phage ECOH1]
MKLWASDFGTFKYTRNGSMVRIIGSNIVTVGDRVHTMFTVELAELSPIESANNGLFKFETYHVNEHGQFNPLGESGLDIISEHPLTKEQLAGYYKTVLERQLATHEQEANYHLQHCENLRAKIEQAERGFYE